MVAKKRVSSLSCIACFALLAIDTIQASETEQQAVFSLDHQITPENPPLTLDKGDNLYHEALQYLQPLENVSSPESSRSIPHLHSPSLSSTFLETVWALYHSWSSSSSSSSPDVSTTSSDTADTASTTITVTSTSDPDPELSAPEAPPPEPSGDLKIALTLLKEAAEIYHHKDSLFTLANVYFFSKYGQPRDLHQAYHYYQQMANLGNATAQQMVGFMYATGYGDVVQRNQAQALLHHTFAGHGGDTTAQMTLGYRYLLGIGTEQKCNDAVYYYKQVAGKVIDHYLSGPPGGLALPLPKVRLSDEAGGVYGLGASMVTDKPSWSQSDGSVSIDEVLQYLRYLAMVKGDVDAQLMLGDMYYYGSRNVPRDFQEALVFFKSVVERLPTGGKALPESLVKSKAGEVIGHAAGYLGRMFMRGEGVSVSYNTAYTWFMIGAELRDSVSMNGLGMLLLKGEQKDYERAIEYFKQAAHLKNPDARVNLGLEYIKHEATFAAGIQQFNLAAESKHILAYWYLGQMYQDGIGMDSVSCQHAVSFYKAIAERGDWLNPTIETAYKAYKDGDIDTALLHYMLAAERGYEIAQANVAYLLDAHYVTRSLPQRLSLLPSPEPETGLEQLALIYWSRSANQNNADARVKMGDYYYYGIGTQVDFDKASACYKVAAELENSPMAMWNLGWMYENGVGVAKDFHLAKRTYDNALVANANAYLPVKLSLLKLYIKQYWGWCMGKDVGHPLFHHSAYSSSTSAQQGADPLHKNNGDFDHGDDFTSEQRAALEQARRRKEIEGYDRLWERGSEEELRRQYNRHMRELEDQDDATYRHYDDEDDEYSEEEELVESVIILGICLLVCWLMYMRRFRANNNNGRQPAPVQPQQPL
ncbi:HCP-like protein [Hesseltinella vesiculosa]|uniref:HCP-like protein n=1 Tax=Hesseltinella vesiculosa TaxID=101127 RepID=A0A1X2GET9_9FUNG|nr:HCP-like protein [Hesseltinella vesiculosa]